MWSKPTACCSAPSSQAAETYTHDERGNVSGLTRDGQAATYQDDTLDRLKAETGPSTQTLTYDANGNRTADASSTYTVAPNSNRLQNRLGASVVYDSAGNVRLERVRINGGAFNRILTYDAANQLANVRINNVLVASYLYDHRGLRGRKTLSNPPAGVPAITLYTYDPNGHLFQEIAGSGNNMGQALVTYLWQDDVPAAIVLGPNTPGNPSAQDKLLYLEVDHLNTPRVARDEQKRVVWRWDSDAFGNTAPNEDPDGDGIKTTINLRFAGQYFDAESGLHYNWHRYYDPQVGRYTQPDPIGVEGGVNPYAYVGGNPLSYTDPKGLMPAAPAAIALCAANIPLCAATAAATCWAYEPCRKSVIDRRLAICKAVDRASDDADRCKQRLVTCRQQCQAKWERGDPPFSGSDIAGRMRRCIRECMEAGGCFNF